ncbi:hypothetical protein JCM33374_g372 [Metschnikowia sp. JCM 33374]|nr:hypothetical protein JCM33374_g372 [Metschnikowia sp. JCM 33374]
MSPVLKNHHNFSPYIMEDWSEFYKHRRQLPVHDSEITNGPQLSIMTYNLFTQCAKRRFRNSNGHTLEHCRYTILAHEIATYSSDIVCLQEVSRVRLSPLELCLQKLGYEMTYSRHSTANTMAICYKKDLFTKVTSEVQYYSDAIEHGCVEHNCALLLSLKFTEEFLQGHSVPSKKGLIIVNTHLPCQDYSWERKSHRTAVLLKFIKKFEQKCFTDDGLTNCYRFVAGDFNVTARDPAYLALVSKPVKISPYFQKESPGLLQMADLHNNIDLRAISLYSVGYDHVDSTNSGIDNERNEPAFSFWGPNWQGLLDYIFIVCDWCGDDRTKVDTLEEFTQASNVKLLALLRMPRKNEMDGSLPQVGMYPSDHLCMMADVELI